jgi:hypothetical protein
MNLMQKLRCNCFNNKNLYPGKLARRFTSTTCVSGPGFFFFVAADRCFPHVLQTFQTNVFTMSTRKPEKGEKTTNMQILIPTFYFAKLDCRKSEKLP